MHVLQSSGKQVLMTLIGWLSQSSHFHKSAELNLLSYPSTVSVKPGETLLPLNHQSPSCLRLHPPCYEKEMPWSFKNT